MAALLGGRAREVIFSGRFLFFGTQHTLFEVQKYLPELAKKLNLHEIDLFRQFELLPIIACQPASYEHQLGRAKQMIEKRDPKDVDVLALALATDFPLWTEDRDFNAISAITVRRTSALLDAIRPAP